MEVKRTIALFWILGLILAPAAWADAELQAIPSSTEITQDENLLVEFKVTSSSAGAGIEQPEFSAPDFDIVNAYSGMHGVQTTMVNGSFSIQRTESYNFVLHPKRAGKFRIQNIRAKVGSQLLKTADLDIQVYPSGTSRPRSGGGQYGQRSALPHSGVHPSKGGSSFFIKTEPSKLKAYRGEQIILTYALYTQAHIVDVSAERYPNVPGFLKEDIDIPMLTRRLHFTPSVVNGQEYQRAVLAQYAIYPVKEGSLTVDPLTAKFGVRQQMRGGIGDDDDPFAMMNQFFNSMQARVESRTSDSVKVEVLPLPAAGQPSSFNGLVGDFSITAVADKYSLKMGDPLNVTVKIEGKGHAGSLEHLNVDWPKDFELYEDKANTNSLRAGYTERIFSFMLIPKVKGKFQIPAIEIAMFNPDSHSYQTRRAEPITIEVLEGSLGNVYVSQAKKAEAPAPAEKKDLRYWMKEDSGASRSLLSDALKVLAILALLAAALSVGSLFFGGRRREKDDSQKASKKIMHRIQSLRNAKLPPERILGEVVSILGEAVSARFGVSVSSSTRVELRELLTAKGVDSKVISDTEQLLEQCENLRFIPGGSDASNARRISEQVGSLVDRIFLVGQ